MAAPLVLPGLGGLEERIHYDEGADRAIIETTQDVEPALNACKALYNADDNWARTAFRRVAHIPASIQVLWIHRYGVDPLNKRNEALLTRLLNDPEWRHLRTAPGRV